MNQLSKKTEMNKACENLAFSMNALASFDSKKTPPKSQFFGTEALLKIKSRELMELILKTQYTKKYFTVQLLLISCIFVKIKLSLNT